MKLKVSLRSREAGSKLNSAALKPWEHISFWELFADIPKANISWKSLCSGNRGQGEICLFSANFPLAINLALTAFLHRDKHTEQHHNEASSFIPTRGGMIAWHSEHGHLPSADALPTSELSMESQLLLIQRRNTSRIMKDANMREEPLVGNHSGLNTALAALSSQHGQLGKVLLYTLDNTHLDKHAFLCIPCMLSPVVFSVQM